MAGMTPQEAAEAAQEAADAARLAAEKAQVLADHARLVAEQAGATGGSDPLVLQGAVLLLAIAAGAYAVWPRPARGHGRLGRVLCLMLPVTGIGAITAAAKTTTALASGLALAGLGLAAAGLAVAVLMSQDEHGGGRQA